MPSGWDIICDLGSRNLDDGRPDLDNPQPPRSFCEYSSVILHQGFIFTRPLTATGVLLHINEENKEEVFFHQMTIDRVEDGLYILQNTQFSTESPKAHETPTVKIPLFDPYYVNAEDFWHHYQMNGRAILIEDDYTIEIVNERHPDMKTGRWYLCPEAYSLELIEELTEESRIYL
ncbi:Oidioi.mRNA.OKI2018_I69.chr1.g1256.t1.cds [Oikopleura dioica]|uniref:Oidioi.mRNA.OKI2018_I69.chr1.g1256.t1.cds n=1 Tax=Oikopleura dioica TaxID=34765 RepID=A0ABN7SP23_OIKDI|nr:Oidioi.mRNA.OKI2018_I69.chr1.g1256.t1.cds [Oikopleura dioica]